jgi:hypothetical protein
MVTASGDPRTPYSLKNIKKTISKKSHNDFFPPSTVLIRQTLNQLLTGVHLE